MCSSNMLHYNVACIVCIMSSLISLEYAASSDVINTAVRLMSSPLRSMHLITLHTHHYCPERNDLYPIFTTPYFHSAVWMSEYHL